MEAIVRHAKVHSGFRVVAVISNRPQAAGLEFAKDNGIETYVVDHKAFEGRESFDKALGNQIDALKPDLVVLAGFMRILTPGFVARFEHRLINVHPSLLPAFPGLNTHQQALNAGVRVHGVTAHLVTAELDHGPILDQAVVPVLENDTAESLAARVLELEHQMYPRAIEAYASGELTLKGGQIQAAKKKAILHSLDANHLL